MNRVTDEIISTIFADIFNQNIIWHIGASFGLSNWIDVVIYLFNTAEDPENPVTADVTEKAICAFLVTGKQGQI